ncbi:MAG: hypothetical protein RSE33_19205, partial [Hafnia sp.]
MNTHKAVGTLQYQTTGSLLADCQAVKQSSVCVGHQRGDAEFPLGNGLQYLLFHHIAGRRYIQLI